MSGGTISDRSRAQTLRWSKISITDLDKERCAAERSVGAIASKIVFETGKTFWLAGEAFRITPSIGVTLFQGTTASAWLDRHGKSPPVEEDSPEDRLIAAWERFVASVPRT